MKLGVLSRETCIKKKQVLWHSEFETSNSLEALDREQEATMTHNVSVTKHSIKT